MPSRAAAVRELLRLGLSVEGILIADGTAKSGDFGVVVDMKKGANDRDARRGTLECPEFRPLPLVLRVLWGRHINCIIAIREARNRIDMDSPPSRKSLRPPRPVAVNPPRGSSTSLRPCRECCAFSRDDRAGSTRQVCFHDLCCLDPARRASLRSKVHGGQRPGPRAGVKVCEPIARRRTGVLPNALWRATRAAGYTDDCYAIA